MQFILDNLSAVMIFSAVAIALAVTQLNSTQASVESTIGYMSKKQTLELGAVMEQELKLIGEGTFGKNIDSAVKNADGQTTSFVFWRNDGSTDIKVEYKLVQTETVKIKGEDVKLYRMDRYENGILTGGSGPTLRDFVVEPLDASGSVVSPASAVLVRARIRNTYPLGNSDDMYLGSSLWGITLRPENL
jgi:hypothetical protein